MKMLFLGHLGNIHKKDDELVHVSPTRSREMSSEFSKVGINTTAAVFWPQQAKQLSDTLEYKHLDDIKVDEYDIVFCHLMLSIQQIYDLSNGVGISRRQKTYDKPEIFKSILNHSKLFLQLDAPRAISKDPKIHNYLIKRIKCTGVATQNAVRVWNKISPQCDVEWVNAATIAYKYHKGNISPYFESNRPKVIYLGRMNDASAMPPLQKLQNIAKLLPEVDFHIVTNKIRDGKTNSVYAINELQEGPGREVRFHNATKLINLPNIFLHRGSKYIDSFDWMHYADCAIGFTVRRGQNVASCKSWEYFGVGVPVVLEEDTPETWILDKVPNGEVAKFGDWKDFANKIKVVIKNSQNGVYKRRKMRKYIQQNHGYNSRVKQWLEIIDRYKK